MNIISKSSLREKYLVALSESDDEQAFIESNASSLYNLDLTIYTKNTSIESIAYNAFSESVLDNKLSLHPEQIRIIGEIKKNRGTIFSAPTSFGKTFVMFEYIARAKPNNVFMIVPTLALVD